MSDQKEKLKIAVLASGQGTNLQALIDNCANGTINGEIKAVVSNKKYAYALTRARTAHIEALVFDPKKHATRTVWCSKIAKTLKDRGIQFICLAGFMVKIEPCLIRSYPNHIINIHPALLPKYGGKGMYGRFVHEAVLKNKENESGCTVHLVDEVFDHGRILAQTKVTISSDETPATLAEKIHAKEHILYVQVLKDVCAGKINLDGPVNESLSRSSS